MLCRSLLAMPTFPIKHPIPLKGLENASCTWLNCRWMVGSLLITACTRDSNPVCFSLLAAASYPQPRYPDKSAHAQPLGSYVSPTPQTTAA
jgi:hypothetical protein